MFINFTVSATLRVAGALASSAEVMAAMQQLVKLPEVARTMQEMSKEMMKAGIIEEMLEDTMESLEPEDMEEEAEDEVNKVRQFFYLINLPLSMYNFFITIKVQ